MFKEAIRKMPRQFAPQSLYNMIGKGLEGSLVLYAETKVKTKPL